MDEPLDVVAKDKCFYFSYAKENYPEQMMKVTKTCPNILTLVCMVMLIASRLWSQRKWQSKFAYAYYRDELKAKDLNADILAQQNGKDDNPHKTKHIDLNDKALWVIVVIQVIILMITMSGIAKGFDKQYELDIIGTSHCRSRTIACKQEEFLIFQMFKQAKGQLIVCHQKWIDSITKQCEAMKTGLKAYRYLSEGVELMTELGVTCDEAELIRTNSTGLVIYNPVNLASMIKGMKNTTITREQKIAIRKAYEQNKVN